MESAAAELARIGKYVLLEQIGRGGMSDVYLAKTEGIEGFERKVALKRIFPALTSHPEFVKSFIHEAKVGGMLYHHNVVQTLDFGRFQDTYFIALEYIEGTHLGALLARCRERSILMPAGVFLQIALQICEGLDYIHHASLEGTDLKLVHRDVKPSNMLITTQGVVKISDFGVVKAGFSSGDRTTAGAVKGTIGYMSPEQALGEEVTHASDVFSLGAMLFEMATLRRLYGEGTDLQILERVRESAFQVPLETAGVYLPGLDKVLRRMLAIRPRDRYSTVAEAASGIRSLPVAVVDRGAMIAFVRSIGLLAPRAKDAGFRMTPPPLPMRLPLPIRAPEPAKPPMERWSNSLHRRLIPASFPTFSSIRQDSAAGAPLKTLLSGMGLVLAGLLLAGGTFWMVIHHLDAREAVPSASALGPRKNGVGKDGEGNDKVNVPAGATRLYVQTVPPRAEVLIDNVIQRKLTPDFYYVTPGQQVRIRREGYQNWERAILPDGDLSNPRWIVTLHPQ